MSSEDLLIPDGEYDIDMSNLFSSKRSDIFGIRCKFTNIF